mmetsp:Transcript_94350/g.215874  ORF Transcript_94350/g.215874 Transcript_94350/m.215874 type:complete len:291 (-) Transcript_94350:92-964(-)
MRVFLLVLAALAVAERGADEDLTGADESVESTDDLVDDGEDRDEEEFLGSDADDDDDNDEGDDDDDTDAGADSGDEEQDADDDAGQAVDDGAVSEFMHALDGSDGRALLTKRIDECSDKLAQCKKDKASLCQRRGYPMDYSSCEEAVKARGKKCKAHKENVRKYNDHEKKKTMAEAKSITHRRRGVAMLGQVSRSRRSTTRVYGGKRYRRRSAALFAGRTDIDRSLAQETYEEEDDDDLPSSHYKESCKTCSRRRRSPTGRDLCNCAREYGYLESYEEFSDIECGSRRRS